MTKRNNRSTRKVTTVEVRQQTKPSELMVLGGSRSDDWNNVIANQAINSLWLNNSDKEGKDKQISATLAGLISIVLKDELESMIAVQLLASHNAAMECYRRAMIGEQTFAGRNENLAQANKLSRTHVTLLEALNRYRGKGQQKVTVEHVHVHAGGQAIVGMVETPGGGASSKLEEQPHALTNAYGTAMPRQDQEANLVPVARDEQRPLPDARRNVPRGPEGK